MPGGGLIVALVGAGTGLLILFLILGRRNSTAVSTNGWRATVAQQHRIEELTRENSRLRRDLVTAQEDVMTIRSDLARSQQDVIRWRRRYEQEVRRGSPG
jgi:hypothetical protein